MLLPGQQRLRILQRSVSFSSIIANAQIHLQEKERKSNPQIIHSSSFFTTETVVTSKAKVATIVTKNVSQKSQVGF